MRIIHEFVDYVPDGINLRKIANDDNLKFAQNNSDMEAFIAANKEAIESQLNSLNRFNDEVDTKIDDILLEPLVACYQKPKTNKKTLDESKK